MHNSNRGNQGRGGTSYNRGGRPDRRGGYGGGYGRSRYQKDQRPRRYPLPKGFSLFYIAVMCPAEINDRVTVMKNWMKDQYGCVAASKSPAHLTIVPPFRAEDEMEANLLDFVSTFNIGVVPFEIRLNGYGNFDSRVLFVKVDESQALMQLERDAMTEFEQHFPSIIFGIKPPFHPHVTIATRDIPEGKLSEAKAHFEATQPFDEVFTVNGLRLVKLVNGTWEVR
jgi:2'-5' RNA ligase